MKIDMSRAEKRAYLKSMNEPFWIRYDCPECGGSSAVAIDVTMEMDHGENKQKYYEMIHFFCLDCKEKFSDWAEND